MAHDFTGTKWVKYSVLYFTSVLRTEVKYSHGRKERKMSAGVCRIQKINGGAKNIAGVQIHNRRERTHSNSNPDIDFEKSAENYTLKDTDLSYNKAVQARIQSGYKGQKTIRKDAVLMCEVLFTSDKAFFERLSAEQERAFFEECYKFAADRYGEENIISAVVHCDEKTPHLHLDFVPLTSDGRLSAKSVLGGKKDLQKLQDDFFAEVGKKWGLERGNRADLDSPNAEKPRSHLETAELKRDTEQKLTELQRKADEIKMKIGRLESRQTKKEKELSALSKELSEKELDQIDTTPQRFTGGFKGLSPQQAQELINTAEASKRQNKALKKELAEEREKNDRLYANLNAEKIESQSEVLKMVGRLADLENQNRLLKRAIGIDGSNYDEVSRALQQRGLQPAKTGKEIE